MRLDEEVACRGVNIAKSFLERYDIDIDWALKSNPGSKSWVQIQTLSFNDCLFRKHEASHFCTTEPGNRNSSPVVQNSRED